jgi:hypothetical protein
MNQRPLPSARRRALYSVLACGLVAASAWVALLPRDRTLSAEPAATFTPMPQQTALGYAPAVFAAGTGSTPSTPAPGSTATPPPSVSTATATTFPTATTTPAAATATHTPTRPPDVLPTPSANPLVIPQTHALTADSAGRLTVRGEVVNQGTVGVESIRVPVEFRNKKGRVVHEEPAMTMIDQLGPGQKACFTVTLDPPQWWRSYTLGEVVYQVDPEPVTGLAVADVDGSRDELLGWYTITGAVSNQSAVDYDLVRLSGTVYDAAGQVIGCDFAYAFNVDLAAGQSDSFELLFADGDYPTAAGWHVAVEGERR